MASADTDRLACTSPPIHRDRNALSALVAVIGFFCVWGVAVALIDDGDVLASFVNLPSMVLVALGPMVLLAGICGWADALGAWTYIFRKPTPGKSAADASTFFQLAAAFALASGFIVTTISLILVLRRLDSPAQLGPAMAVALLSQLYGVFMAVGYIAAAAYIARKHQGPGVAAPVARRAAGVAGVTAIAGILTTMIAFGILMLSMAPSF